MAHRETMPVGIVVERRRLASPWQDHDWHAVAVLPGAPEAGPWTTIAEGDGWTRYHAGIALLEMFEKETQTYQFNIEGAQPAVYVFLRRADNERGIDLLGATVCAGEADAHSGAGDDIIDAVAMPPAVLDWVRAFVAAHPPLLDFYKRERRPADPEALARGDGGDDRRSRGDRDG
jgi:hypothetical protein